MTTLHDERKLHLGQLGSVHSHNIVSAEALTEIANALQSLPSEQVAQLYVPLADLIRAAGVAVGKVK